MPESQESLGQDFLWLPSVPAQMRLEASDMVLGNADLSKDTSQQQKTT
jgi:hypothetical protein